MRFSGGPTNTFSYTWRTNAVQLAALAAPNGVTNIYRYATNSTQLASLSVWPNPAALTNGTPLTPVLKCDYQYDLADRCTRLDRPYESRFTQYTYTEERVTAVSLCVSGVITSAQWFYDTAGNRLVSSNALSGTLVSTAHTYNNLNQIRPTPTMAPSLYDADGNMTNLPVASGTGGGWTLYWDAENRLTEIANATTRIVNTFDSQHRRVRKQVYTDNTLVTDAAYLYDGWNLVAETISDPQSTHTNFYIWGVDRDDSHANDSGGVGGLLAIIRDTTVYYPVMNHHGDVMALIDDSGSNIVARYEYDPWGVLLSATGPAVDACPFRWQTKYIDAETGLYYFGYRFFDSLTGRWLSRDPLEEDGGVNLYAFCGNDPVNGVDPLGLRPRVTTWLRSGFVYWDVDDMPDNVRDQVYSTDYTEEGWFSTRAGTHAIIGCLGIFESIGHLVYDAGRAAGGSVDDENVWLGLMNATIDEGPAYVAKEMLFAPYNAITSGDAEQAGGAVFGLYIFSRQAHASGKGYLKARGEGAGNWTAVKAAMRSKTEPIRLRRPAATPPRVGPTVENAKSIAAENIVSIDQLNASHFSSEYGEAVFYAGRGKLNRLAANASGGTTIGSTAGGQALDRIVDWESMSMQESRAFAAPYSEMFAEQASGPIRSWAGGASLESVWRQTELPALLRNLKVTKITILDAARPEITRIIYPKR